MPHPAGQGQGEEKPEYRQAGYDEHGDGEARAVSDEAEQRRPGTAEPDGETHRDTGRESDASGQVLLSHYDGDAESTHGRRPDDDEYHHARVGAGEREAEDQGP